MNNGRSWTASIVGFALAVLAVAYALNVAADLLRQALPVLIPVAVLVGIGIGLWQWRSRTRGW
jgi:hypothetical protein